MAGGGTLIKIRWIHRGIEINRERTFNEMDTARTTKHHRLRESVTPEPVAEPSYPDIIIAIFHVDTHTEPIEFHWAFFVQNPGKDFGVKSHATDISDSWEYGTGPFTLVTSESVAAAVIIGQIPATRSLDDLDRILKSIPMNVIPDEEKDREDKFDCRVWLREGVRRLIKEGWIRCRDVYALEDEVQLHGEAACEEMNRGTYTSLMIHKSRYSS